MAWLPGLLERKNNNKVESFSTYFSMFTLTWITDKELQRVIKKKETNFVGKKKHENFIAAVRMWEMLAVSKERPAG